MRVSLFSCFYEEPNGISTFTHALEKYFTGKIELQVISADKRLRIQNIEKGKETTALLAPFFDRQLIADWVTNFSPDLIHVTGPTPMGDLGLELAKQFNIPVISSWHVNYPRFIASHTLAQLPKGMPEKVIADIEKQITTRVKKHVHTFYSQTNAIVAPTKPQADELAAEYDVPVYTAGRGVDLDLYHPDMRSRGTSTFYLGYVGRLTADKGVRMLPEIDARLSGRFPYQFSIVGAGPLECELKSKMKRADFHGILKGNRLALEYANMNALIFPSYSDTFGQVVLEALASGVVPIVHRDSAISKEIPELLTGFDLMTFCSAIEYAYIIPPVDRIRITRQAAEKFPWEKPFSELLRVYNSYL